MNRFSSPSLGFVAGALLLTMATAPSLADAPLTADLTGDRIIDVADFGLLYRHLQGPPILTAPQLAVSDVNHDGSVDFLDLRRGMGRYGRFVHFEVPPFDPFNPLRPVLLGATPGFGPERTLVTLTGTGFGPTPADNVVRLAGQAVPVLSATPTSLTFRVPFGGSSGSLTVDVSGLESMGIPFLVGTEMPGRNPGFTIGAQDVGLELPMGAVAPGALIAIPVSVNSGARDFVGVDVRITFDPTVLRAIEMDARPIVRFGRDFYRCIDNTTGIIAAAVGVDGTQGRAVPVADVIFEVVGEAGQIAVVGGRINALVDMNRPESPMGAFPRFFETSHSFIAISDGGYSETVRLLDAPLIHATANMLPDGRVLIAGGDGNGGGPRREVTLYDSATTHVESASVRLHVPRTQHTATSLPDGRIVVAGGDGASGPLSSVEVFDPGTGSFRLLSRGLSEVRAEHTAILLSDGRIAWFGGRGAGGPSNVLSSVEVFDPANERIITLARPLAVARRGASLSILGTGEVLVTGGFDSSGEGVELRNTEVYDPIRLLTRTTDGSGRRVDALHRGARLASGTIVLTGDDDVRAFDLQEDEYDGLASLSDPRLGHVAAALPDGRLFVGGGYGEGGRTLKTSEVLTQAGTFVAVEPGPRLFFGRGEATGLTLPDGRVLVIGGVNFGGEAMPILEVVRP